MMMMMTIVIIQIQIKTYKAPVTFVTMKSATGVGQMQIQIKIMLRNNDEIIMKLGKKNVIKKMCLGMSLEACCRSSGRLFHALGPANNVLTYLITKDKHQRLRMAPTGSQRTYRLFRCRHHRCIFERSLWFSSWLCCSCWSASRCLQTRVNLRRTRCRS